MTSPEGWLQVDPGMIAMVGSDHFGTGGRAPQFVGDRFQARVDAGQSVPRDGVWQFDPGQRAAVLQALQTYRPA